jgi:butyryl-CoA dehydrogenase/short/branched chain acyl-CoA dehydrogenase
MSPCPLTLLSEDEHIFREAVSEFAKEQIGPHTMEMDESMTLRPEIIRACFDMGLMGIEIPEAYGGSGSTFFNSILAIEAIAEVDASVSVFVDVQNTLVINAILKWGNDEQKSRYLPKLAQNWVSGYALSESGSGSDAFALKTRAVREGDEYVLNGSKLWITNAIEAELFVLMATVNPEAGYRGITAFLVEKGLPGLEVGKKEEKLGIRASSTCELILDNCRVPAENVLGEVGKGVQGGY